MRTVDSGQRHLSVQEWQHHIFTGEYGCHCTIAGNLIHQPAACGNQPQCIGKIDAAGNHCRSVFAQTVTRQCDRFDTAGCQHARQCDADCQQCRLRECGAINLRRRIAQQTGQRPAQHVVGFSDRGPEQVVMQEQIARHARPLRTLARTEQRKLRCAPRCNRGDGVRVAALRNKIGQRLSDTGKVVCHDCQTVTQMRPTDVRERCQSRPRMLVLRV